MAGDGIAHAGGAMSRHSPFSIVLSDEDREHLKAVARRGTAEGPSGARVGWLR